MGSSEMASLGGVHSVQHQGKAQILSGATGVLQSREAHSYQTHKSWKTEKMVL